MAENSTRIAADTPFLEANGPESAMFRVLHRTARGSLGTPLTCENPPAQASYLFELGSLARVCVAPIHERGCLASPAARTAVYR